ncbi:MAG TPA: hypothetical protein VN026_03630 [Bacteroidia bacterium]|jgi:hypothetical protein|nr:hypothetical protein [Bacteroidia bacterium]
MNFRKKYFLFFLLFNLSVFSQSNPDSLISVLQKGKEDTNKVNTLHKLYLTYHSLGQEELALGYYEKYIFLRDSLINKENAKHSLKAEMQFEYDKREAIAKVHQEEKTALAAQEYQQQRIIIYSISGGLLLLLLLSGFILRGYRQKQKSHFEISKQKQIIEEKQKEIIDSILYAKRIQQSLMPTDKYILQKTKALQKTK